MKLIDTQIVSYAFTDSTPEMISDCWVPTIALGEFLECHGPDLTRANYYIPLLPKLTHRHMPVVLHDRPFGKRHTDQLILDFGADFPSVMHFGNLALCYLVNEGRRDLFSAAVSGLSKRNRKRLAKRFAFLVESNIVSVPLCRQAVADALELFLTFSKSHTPKANLRNTLNDMLILATAAREGALLITHDS